MLLMLLLLMLLLLPQIKRLGGHLPLLLRSTVGAGTHLLLPHICKGVCNGQGGDVGGGW